MKKVFILLILLFVGFLGWGQIIISGFLANPAGTDGNYEYIQLKATQAIDFSASNYCIVVANNGAATASGWAEGGAITYKFNLTSGTVALGGVFYVGGSGKLINGSGSTDISSANWIRTISVANTSGDGFGSSNSVGVVGNGGSNADGIAVFSGTNITSTSIPIDVIFYGTGVGTALGASSGYKVCTNDIYSQSSGLFGQGSNTTIFNDPSSANFVKLSGTFNLTTSAWTTPRTSTSILLTASSQLSDIESNITLPVSLLSFSSNKLGKINLLNWSTASEQNNSGFNIERSTNGTDFENIGFVKSLSSNGNSSSRLDYSFTDINPIGLNQYYRLKQTDFDGTHKYSAIVMVRREAPTALTLTKVYPNPANSSIYINASVPTKMDLQFLIIDVAGRVVSTKNAFADVGNNGFDMTVEHLESGTYFIKAISKEQGVVTTEKFIKF
jgi:hypothetical protein